MKKHHHHMSNPMDGKNSHVKHNHHGHNGMAPFMKKRNRRLKMIHSSMHKNLKDNSSPYGYMEFVKRVRSENDLPVSDFVYEYQKPAANHGRPSFVDSNSLFVQQPKRINAIKKSSRFRPETGIMQKFEEKEKKIKQN